MVRHVDFRTARTIIELGPGDGAITEHILQEMRPDAVLLAFEVSEGFVRLLRERFTDPRLYVIPDGAEHLRHHLREHQIKQVDAVISAIPFLNLPAALLQRITHQCLAHLRSGGKFVQFHYSPHPVGRYRTIFGNARINFIPVNFPPAFVIVCEKKSKRD
jgi:phosphatidylethanolamine/phosphatidyl-N-methylethanolamine N-methyltransferase